MQKQKLKKAEQRKAQQANKASNKAAANKAAEQQALRDQAAAIAAAAFAQGSEAESDHQPEVKPPLSIKEQAAAIAAAAFAQAPPQSNHQVSMLSKIPKQLPYHAQPVYQASQLLTSSMATCATALLLNTVSGYKTCYRCWSALPSI